MYRTICLKLISFVPVLTFCMSKSLQWLIFCAFVLYWSFLFVSYYLGIESDKAVAVTFNKDLSNIIGRLDNGIHLGDVIKDVANGDAISIVGDGKSVEQITERPVTSSLSDVPEKHGSFRTSTSVPISSTVVASDHAAPSNDSNTLISSASSAESSPLKLNLYPPAVSFGDCAIPSMLAVGGTDGSGTRRVVWLLTMLGVPQCLSCEH